MTYPTDCPCGSRCDGHAVAAPEDPGTEWCGVGLMDALHWSTRTGRPPAEMIEETRYSDRSPREGWEAAWRVHRATR